MKDRHGNAQHGEYQGELPAQFLVVTEKTKQLIKLKSEKIAVQ